MSLLKALNSQEIPIENEHKEKLGVIKSGVHTPSDDLNQNENVGNTTDKKFKQGVLEGALDDITNPNSGKI